MTPLPPEVRLATLADAQEVFDTLMVNYQENGLASLSKDKVAMYVKQGVMRDNASIGIIRGEKRIEATIGLVIGEWWYSQDKHVEEVWNFVHPDHRRSTHAKHLIEFAKWVSDSLELPLLMGVLTTKRLAAKERLYERQLPKVGALFLHNIPQAAPGLMETD